MKILDGPAEGVSLLLRTCPVFLRLVRDQTTNVWDALDQEGDEPGDNEVVYPYRLVPGTLSIVFIRPGGRYEMGDYTSLDQYLKPAERELIRNRQAWISWVRLHFPEDMNAS